MQLIVTDRDDQVEEYSVTTFADLFMTLSDDIKIEALCGGCCSCATCHVYLDEESIENVVEASELEREVVEGLLHARSGSRLLCQLEKKETAVINQMKITLAQPE